MSGRLAGLKGNRSRPRRLAAQIGATIVVFLIATIAPAWAGTLHSGSLINGFLRASLLVYVLMLTVGAFGSTILGSALILMRRRGGRSRPFLAKSLLLCVSCLISLILVEGLALSAGRPARRQPPVKIRPGLDEPSYPGRLTEGPPGSLRILVLGESSALGIPFDPKLSVGQIVAWGLGRVLPGRTVDTEILAYAGAPLEGMHVLLPSLKRRPDIVLIYSGHNEFQAQFAWARTPNYYADDVVAETARPWWDRPIRRSPVCRLILGAIESRKLSIPPPARATRGLIDRPCCTAGEMDDMLRRFAHRLDGMVAYAEKIGALPVLIVPPGNDAGFEPSRSVLSADTLRADRDDFAREFLAVRAIESSQPARAVAAYRTLIERQPTFAEAHYRLAGLFERQGDRAEANRHYLLARNLDGMPMRCPSAFQDVYLDVARRHPKTLLIDGPAVLRRLSPSGILDDGLFLDAQHPTLKGHAGLAAAVLEGLRARRAFNWPPDAPVPAVDPAACASHFGIDAAAWVKACRNSATFYDRTAYIRSDPTARLARRDFYLRAAEQIAAGVPPATAGVP